MIGYATLGTNRFEASAEFYDALLAEFGATRVMESDTTIIWATGMDQPALAIIKPFDGKPASVGNGSMIGLAMSGREQVEAVHALALELGGTNEGDPGVRGEGSFYAAYFRDPDGNKLALFHIG